jgi:DNA repair photolyase
VTYYREVKNALRRELLPGVFIPALYRFSPYQGCGHACLYCDGRAEKYYVEGDFESDIGVKDNMPDILRMELGCFPEDGAGKKHGTETIQPALFDEMDFVEGTELESSLPSAFPKQELPRQLPLPQRDWGAVSVGSGISDVYQPVEQDEQVTRRCLTVLKESGAGLPVTILTKSALILRDFDLLTSIAEQALVRYAGPDSGRLPVLILTTITTTCTETASVLEPGASPPEERLELIRRAREAGFYAGVMAMPLVPYITDGTPAASPVIPGSDPAELFRAAAEAGAECIIPGGLTLRPGRQKDIYMETLRQKWPALYSDYEWIYGEQRRSGAPRREFYRDRPGYWAAELEKLCIPSGIPHYIYRSLLSEADSLFTLLCHMEYLYASRGIETRGLRDAAGRYSEWLKLRRTALRRKRAWVTEELTRELREMTAGDGFEKLTGNPRLSSFVREIVNSGRNFNYITGKTEHS